MTPGPVGSHLGFCFWVALLPALGELFYRFPCSPCLGRSPLFTVQLSTLEAKQGRGEPCSTLDTGPPLSCDAAGCRRRVWVGVSEVSPQFLWKGRTLADDYGVDGRPDSVTLTVSRTRPGVTDAGRAVRSSQSRAVIAWD